jgi:Protein of unknown function (DUF3551)
MKTVHKVTMASTVISSAFAFVAMASCSARAGPIVPPGHYCLAYDVGGSDCSFTSYAQCQATALGIDAECYGGDDGSQIQSRRSYEARAQSAPGEDASNPSSSPSQSTAKRTSRHSPML